MFGRLRTPICTPGVSKQLTQCSAERWDYLVTYFIPQSNESMRRSMRSLITNTGTNPDSAWTPASVIFSVPTTKYCKLTRLDKKRIPASVMLWQLLKLRCRNVTRSHRYRTPVSATLHPDNSRWCKLTSPDSDWTPASVMFRHQVKSKLCNLRSLEIELKKTFYFNWSPKGDVTCTGC